MGFLHRRYLNYSDQLQTNAWSMLMQIRQSDVCMRMFQCVCCVWAGCTWAWEWAWHVGMMIVPCDTYITDTDFMVLDQYQQAAVLINASTFGCHISLMLILRFLACFLELKATVVFCFCCFIC